MGRIDDTNFLIGNDSYLSLWKYGGKACTRKINFENIKGKVYFIEKFRVKYNKIFMITCDKRSIKLWDKSDISFVNEIEYPQSNLIENIKNLISFEKIMKVFKINEGSLIVFNQSLNIISLVNFLKWL